MSLPIHLNQPCSSSCDDEDLPELNTNLASYILASLNLPYNIFSPWNYAPRGLLSSSFQPFFNFTPSLPWNYVPRGHLSPFFISFPLFPLATVPRPCQAVKPLPVRVYNGSENKSFLTYIFLPHLPIYNPTLPHYPIFLIFLPMSSISFPLPSQPYLPQLQPQLQLQPYLQLHLQLPQLPQIQLPHLSPQQLQLPTLPPHCQHCQHLLPFNLFSSWNSAPRGHLYLHLLALAFICDPVGVSPIWDDVMLSEQGSHLSFTTPPPFSTFLNLPFFLETTPHEVTFPSHILYHSQPCWLWPLWLQSC